LSIRVFFSEAKPNGYTTTCRDCSERIYLHRGNTDRWRAFERPTAIDAGADDWVRHRCPSGLQDAELMSLVAPAGVKPAQLIDILRQLIAGFEGMIEQAEARIDDDGAKAASVR
jgi:hypothetical protein